MKEDEVWPPAPLNQTVKTKDFVRIPLWRSVISGFLGGFAGAVSIYILYILALGIYTPFLTVAQDMVISLIILALNGITAFFLFQRWRIIAIAFFSSGIATILWHIAVMIINP